MRGDDASPAAPEAGPPSHESPPARLWRRFLKVGGAKAGLALVSVFALTAFFAPFLAHRLPLAWHDGDGWSFPLIREFFSPSDTTEPLLEAGVNFLLLYIPLAWLAWRLSGRLFPRLAAGESRLLAVSLGVILSASLWALIGGMLREGAGEDWFYYERRPAPEIEDVNAPELLLSGAAGGDGEAAAAVWNRLSELGLEPAAVAAAGGEAAKKAVLEPLRKAVEGPVMAPLAAFADRKGASDLDIAEDGLQRGMNRVRWNRFLVETAFPGLLVPMRQFRHAFIVLAAAAVVVLSGLTCIFVAGAGQFALNLRWLPLLLLAVPLSLAFRQPPRYNHVPYRQLAAEGGGFGVFPLVPYGPNEQGFGPRLPPFWLSSSDSYRKKPGHLPGRHFLGTDESGRDVLVRIIHGARVSMSVGFVSVLLSTAIGLVLGSTAAYYGGRIDMAISRFLEIMLCFPSFFLILAVIAVLDRRSIINIMLVIGLTSWTGVARLVRGEMLRQRKLDYVTASVALGASDVRTIFRHILPNAMAPVLVSVSFGITGAILTEAGLSFIGFGVTPPTPTWGQLLSETRDSPLANWWLAVFPGAVLFLGVAAYNLVGEAMRDALDPRISL